MRTKHSLIFLIFIMFITVTGCGSSHTDKQIQDNQNQAVVKEFKSKLYTIPNYTSVDNSLDIKAISEKYKSYFTDSGFNAFVANKVPLIPLQSASRGKYNLELKDITLNNVSSTESKVVYDYELTIKVSYPEKKSQKDIKESGQITLVKEADSWKIDNDHFNLNDLFKETLK